MSKALIIIDLQSWFFRTGERAAKLPWLLDGINSLIPSFTSAGLPIIVVRTIFSSDPNTWDQYMRANNKAVLIEHTPSAKDVDGLVLPGNVSSITKTRHSTFIRTDFEKMLRQMNVTSLLLTGAFVDGCVGLTAIDAWERDFEVTLAKEAVISTEEEQRNAMLRFLNVEFGIEALSHQEILSKLA